MRCGAGGRLRTCRRRYARCWRNKNFAVIGFEAAEAARITRALEHARARCRMFHDLPDNDTLQPFHAGVVNVCQGEGIFSWVTQRAGVR